MALTVRLVRLYACLSVSATHTALLLRSYLLMAAEQLRRRLPVLWVMPAPSTVGSGHGRGVGPGRGCACSAVRDAGWHVGVWGATTVVRAPGLGVLGGGTRVCPCCLGASHRQFRPRRGSLRRCFDPKNASEPLGQCNFTVLLPCSRCQVLCSALMLCSLG
jgi:hypothetical protein